MLLRKYNQVTDFGKFVVSAGGQAARIFGTYPVAEQGAIAGWMVCVILAL